METNQHFTAESVDQALIFHFLQAQQTTTIQESAILRGAKNLTLAKINAWNRSN